MTRIVLYLILLLIPAMGLHAQGKVTVTQSSAIDAVVNGKKSPQNDKRMSREERRAAKRAEKRAPKTREDSAEESATDGAVTTQRLQAARRRPEGATAQQPSASCQRTQDHGPGTYGRGSRLQAHGARPQTHTPTSGHGDPASTPSQGTQKRQGFPHRRLFGRQHAGGPQQGRTGGTEGEATPCPTSPSMSTSTPHGGCALWAILKNTRMHRRHCGRSRRPATRAPTSSENNKRRTRLPANL